MNSGRQSGIARVVERVDADDEIARAEHFGPAERERQKNRVPRRHVRGRNVRLAERSRSRGTVDVRCQRRSADAAQVDAQLLMARDAERPRDRARGVHLPRVPLAVVNGQRVQRRSRRRSRADGRGRSTNRGRRSEATTDAYAIHTPRVSGVQMNLCSCSCTRTGSRSAITHSDSVFGSSTPCTGENRIAAARDASCVRVDDVARELVVGAIGEDELHLVVRREAVEVGPVVLVGFAAARTLDVDDLHDARRHAIDRPVPAGFEHHRVAGREQPIHQRRTRLPAAAARRR